VRRADHVYRGVLWISVCFERCLLSGRSLYDGLNTCTDESYGWVTILCVVCCQVCVVGPCHHGMARPQVADRGTASDKEGSCE